MGGSHDFQGIDAPGVAIDENMISSDAKPILIYADQPKVAGAN